MEYGHKKQYEGPFTYRATHFGTPSLTSWERETLYRSNRATLLCQPQGKEGPKLRAPRVQGLNRWNTTFGVT